MSDNDKSEQYRAGFEAYALAEGYELRRDASGFYFHGHAAHAWRVWCQAKREASTEPSAQPSGNSGELAAGALPDEAKDAARYRFLRHADLDAIAAGHWRTGRVLDGARFDDAIDAAIEAQARAGKAPHTAAETMDHDQLEKLGQHYQKSN